MRLHSFGFNTGFFGTLRSAARMQLAGVILAALCACTARGDGPNDDYVNKIRRSHFVTQPLEWVGDAPPSEEDSRELWVAIGEGGPKSLPDIAASLEEFAKAHPQSPWRAALEDRLGTYYRKAGNFSIEIVKLVCEIGVTSKHSILLKNPPFLETSKNTAKIVNHRNAYNRL